MDSIIRRVGLLAVAFFASISCAEQQNVIGELQAPGFQPESIEILSSNTLDVVDQNGSPIAGATILIGYEAGNPFSGNIVTTNANGRVNAPSSWKAALPVTAQAAGYVTTTLPVAVPGDHTIILAKQEGSGEYEVSGTPTDFGRLPTDGKVDFALVIPALSRESMLSFDISSVMSPKNDTIEIIGNEVDIPSNLVLPRQRETYIFPIELNKPTFRSYVRTPDQYLISATRGNFPLQRVVNDIRGGKSIFEVVNHFNFTEGGQQQVEVRGNVGGVNLSVNQIPFNSAVSVLAPNYPAGHVMMSLTLLENNGRFMPADLKRIQPRASLNLKASTAVGPVSVLSLLIEEGKNFQGMFSKWFAPLIDIGGEVSRATAVVPANPDFGKFSFALLPANNGVAPQFLPLVGKPRVSGQVLALDMPALPAGMVQVASYMVLSEVQEIGGGSFKNERRTRLWEVWSPAWLQQVELPKIAINRRPDRKYRWEVLFMARPANFVGTPAVGTGVDLNTVTHVTRNAVEI